MMLPVVSSKMSPGNLLRDTLGTSQKILLTIPSGNPARIFQGISHRIPQDCRFFHKKTTMYSKGAFKNFSRIVSNNFPEICLVLSRWIPSEISQSIDPGILSRIFRNASNGSVRNYSDYSPYNFPKDSSENSFKTSSGNPLKEFIEDFLKRFLEKSLEKFLEIFLQDFMEGLLHGTQFVELEEFSDEILGNLWKKLWRELCGMSGGFLEKSAPHCTESLDYDTRKKSCVYVTEERSVIALER